MASSFSVVAHPSIEQLRLHAVVHHARWQARPVRQER
jgi:hypothetical protein